MINNHWFYFMSSFAFGTDNVTDRGDEDEDNNKSRLKAIRRGQKRSLQWFFWMVPACVAVWRVPHLPIKSHQASASGQIRYNHRQSIRLLKQKNQPLKSLWWSGVFACGLIWSCEVFDTCHSSKFPCTGPSSLWWLSVVTIISKIYLNICFLSKCYILHTVIRVNPTW